VSELDDLQKRVESMARTDKAAEKISVILKTYGKNTFSIGFLRDFLGETLAHDIRRYENLQERPSTEGAPESWKPKPTPVVVIPRPVAPKPEIVRQAPASNNDALEEHTAPHDPEYAAMMHRAMEYVQRVFQRTPEGLLVPKSESVPCAEPPSKDERVPFIAQESANAGLPEPKVEIRLPEPVTVDPPNALEPTEAATETDLISQTDPSVEELVQKVPELVSQISEPTTQTTSNVPRTRPRRNPWASYERPESQTRLPRPKLSEPSVLMPPRAERQTPLHRTASVPDYVRDAKITEQGGRCTWCQRAFGSPILHHGEVEILTPQVEHFIPRAAGGRTADKNCNYSCQICNRLKHDYVFDTVAELIDFLDREWMRHGYTECPPLIPFRRDPSFGYLNNQN